MPGVTLPPAAGSSANIALDLAVDLHSPTLATGSQRPPEISCEFTRIAHSAASVLTESARPTTRLLTRGADIDIRRNAGAAWSQTTSSRVGQCQIMSDRVGDDVTLSGTRRTVADGVTSSGLSRTQPDTVHSRADRPAETADVQSSARHYHSSLMEKTVPPVSDMPPF